MPPESAPPQDHDDPPALAATAIRLTDQGRLNVILAGIDRTETESKYGWWKTSDGARFGAERLREVEAPRRPLRPYANDALAVGSREAR